MHKYSNFLQNGNIMHVLQLCVIDKKVYMILKYTKRYYKKPFIHDKIFLIKVHSFEIYVSIQY